MLTGKRQDTTPTVPWWQPAPYFLVRKQARRQEINDRASMKWRTTSQDIQNGDQVIINDQSLVGNIRTPFEPGIWTVTGMAGNMVTAVEKGRERVTHNVSWFRKATFVEPSDELDSDDYSTEWSPTGDPERGCEGDLQTEAGPTTQRQPVTSTPVALEGKMQNMDHMYQLYNFCGVLLLSSLGPTSNVNLGEHQLIIYQHSQISH
ncbi:hypothetical protein NDU88_004743 [Pleurodeles waltl]|uniref:Uncharacterized protein n=1 Tax=Pleurodeles waltl TaxID=8319 RepID=A0AAV7WXJ4_PLEWA|nr:hypothetical protein NDU88_004743 [Pleurodeles waltl]